MYLRELASRQLGLLFSLFLILGCLYSTMTVGTLTAAEAKSGGRVLFIASYHPSFRSFDQQVSGLKSVLVPAGVDLDIEFMDSKRFPSQEHRDHFLADLRRKMAELDPYDVIVVADDNALHMALKQQDDLFKGMPIVFCSVNNVPLALELNKNDHVTGVVEAVSVKETIQLVSDLLPENPFIYVTSDNSKTGRANWATFERAVIDFPEVKFLRLNLEDHTHEEFDRKLASIKGGEGVLLWMTAYLDRQGQYRSQQAMTESLERHANIPVFKLQAFDAGDQIVGGCVIDHKMQGREAGEKVLKILDGQSPAQLPVVGKSPNVNLFDYEMLNKYGIDMNRLPQDAVVLQMPSRFWEDHPEIVKTGISVMIFLTVILVILSVYSGRLHHAKSKLALLSSIVEHSQDFVGTADLKGQVTYLNKAWRDFLELKAGDEKQKVISDFHPEWAQKIVLEKAIPRGMQEGHWLGDTAILGKNGEEVPVSQAVIAHKNSKGEALNFSTVIRDISDRKRAEEALRESEENLRITLNSIGDAVIATDREMRVLRMNPVAEELTGWSQDEVSGKPLEEIFRIENLYTREKVPNPAEKVIETGMTVGLANHTVLVARNGMERQIADSAAPITSTEGEIVGVVLVFRDITEQYEMEEQLKQAQKMESLGQLAGGVAHDFNNMLLAIMGTAELLSLELEEDEEKLALMQTILNASDKASTLTKQLLAFSRRSQPQKQLVDVHRILDSSITILRRSIDRMVEIEVCENAKKTSVSVDASQIENAIINMGINARDAMPHGGTVIFTTEDMDLDAAHPLCESGVIKPGAYVCIHVRDSGVGMDKQTMDRVFEPFFTTKDVGEGTGLGLASVYGSLREHGGTVTVDSTLGEGTQFSIYLPAVSGDVPALKETDVSPDRVRGSGTVLVIDDEDVVRLATRNMLTQLGYQVITASDGEAGLAAYQNHEHIDLVILDLVMPRLDGKGCFKALKEMNPDVCVVMVTGFAKDADLDELKAQGVFEVLRKPFKLDRFSATVAKAMDARTAVKNNG